MGSDSFEPVNCTACEGPPSPSGGNAVVRIDVERTADKDCRHEVMFFCRGCWAALKSGEEVPYSWEPSRVKLTSSCAVMSTWDMYTKGRARRIGVYRTKRMSCRRALYLRGLAHTPTPMPALKNL